ncbi:hypothetical protein ACHQM5_029800 [Ranunculus cassubicifolius]
MAFQRVTEYERKRLENIKRNEQMMASLKLQSKANELQSESKRQRTEKPKNPKSETPIVGARRSLRTKGIQPDPSSAKGLSNYYVGCPVKHAKSQLLKKLGPLSMQDIFLGDSSDRTLINTINDISENTPLSSLEKRGFVGNGECFDSSSMVLKRENIAHAALGRIMEMKFFPCIDRSMIVAGDAFGDVVFWNVDCMEGEGGGIYRYRPYTLPVSGISIKPFSLSKVFTSSYDGFIRMLDFESESFEFIHKSDSSIFSLSQRPQDSNLIYFSENQGFLNIWDTRAGKSSSSYVLHDAKIYTIDFNPVNTYVMATSSADKTVRIWDLRQMGSKGPKCLKFHQHKTAVHSAYFSPSGKSLATTSLDNHVGIFSGVDLENASIIYHNNHTGKWISSFRAIWGWDDTSLFTGSMIKEVDVIHTDGGISHLRSSDMMDIPCQLTAHPHKVGTLAAATSGGQIYLWAQKVET